jgi:hypothetical protein
MTGYGEIPGGRRSLLDLPTRRALHSIRALVVL